MVGGFGVGAGPGEGAAAAGAGAPAGLIGANWMLVHPALTIVITSCGGISPSIAFLQVKGLTKYQATSPAALFLVPAATAWPFLKAELPSKTVSILNWTAVHVAGSSSASLVAPLCASSAFKAATAFSSGACSLSTSSCAEVGVTSPNAAAPRSLASG